MIITYQRPDTIGHNIDPEAPNACRSVDGSECGAETIDIDGVQWRCTRLPHPGQDEHRAAYERDGDGPDGAVAIAWTYQYAGCDQTGADTDHAAPRTLHHCLVPRPGDRRERREDPCRDTRPFLGRRRRRHPDRHLHLTCVSA